jgi:hypothetical protein
MEQTDKKGIFIEILDNFEVSLQIEGETDELIAAFVAGMEDERSNFNKLVFTAVSFYMDRHDRRKAGK